MPGQPVARPSRFAVRHCFMPHTQPSADLLPLAQSVLQEVFGYPGFRGLQSQVISHAAAGGSALVLMPTGAGKSLCYQVPAIVRHRQGHGVTIVVSPLIALMHDQVGALDEVGVRAAFLNSTLSSAEAQAVEKALLSAELTLLYAAPERITHPRFLAMLDSLAERGLLSLFAIDEAHCVSQWGHDFREEYLALSLLQERYPQVPRLGLTATADTHTRQDILHRLGLEGQPLFISSFDRPNIHYTLVEKDNARQQLLRFIRAEHEGDAGIVYCQSRKKVEDTAQWLSEQGIPALPYHAGLTSELRQHHQDRFLREDGLVMVATVAFGMGIDKPDVRFVAHLDLPKNIESYYQETGRAGRDGQPADAWLTYGLQDVVQQRRMIDESPASEEFKRVQREKLDALLGLAEAHDCRRVRLLRYFGEESLPCGHCDNCQHPPEVWDATEPARKLLSCIYRLWQSGGQRFGAGHIIDILRGKANDKIQQHGHASLSTYGIGQDLSESQWRGVVRQLLAQGCLSAEGEFNTLALAGPARAVLKGEQSIWLRVAQAPTPKAGRLRKGSSASAGEKRRRHEEELAQLGGAAARRLQALRDWRAEVAKAHNVPAYVIFHDATLLQMAVEQPATLDDLSHISGVGSKKREAYGEDLLRVLAQG